MRLEKKIKVNRYIYAIRVLAAVFILVFGSYFALTDKEYDAAYNKVHQYTGVNSIELRADDVIEQVITFEKERLNNLGIWAVNRTHNCKGDVLICLVDGNETVVWQQKMPVSHFVLQSVTWFTIKQQVTPFETYILRLKAEQITGSLHLALVDQDRNSEGIEENAIKNGIEQAQSVPVQTVFYESLRVELRILIILWAVIIAAFILAFEKLFSDKISATITFFILFDVFAVSAHFLIDYRFEKHLNYIMFAGLVCSFVAVLVMYLIMYMKKCERVECYFAVSALIFGMVFSVILPPYSTPDEGFHYAEAYRLSNAIIGQPINDEHGYVYMRECDIREIEHYPNNEYTIDMIKNLIRGTQDLSETMMPSDNIRNGRVPIYMYMPQAIGLTIGRVLHMNFERTIYLGRLMNLLFFTAAVCLSIKIIPYGKWIFFAICQIPILMELTSSYSYDVTVLSFAFLFVAYLVKLCGQCERIEIRQLLMLTLISVMFVIQKPVYVPLIGLVFLIPDRSISKSRKKSLFCKVCIWMTTLIFLLLVQKFAFLSMENIQNDITATADANDDNMEMEMSTEYQITDTNPQNLLSIEFISENPFALIEGYLGAFVDSIDNYLLELFGDHLGWLCIQIPTYVLICLMVLIGIAFSSEQSEIIPYIRNATRCWTALMAAGSFMSVLLSMYWASTNVSERTIQGVQGRYMLPILIILPVFLNRKGVNSNYRKLVILMMALMIQILSILNIGVQSWNR